MTEKRRGADMDARAAEVAGVVDLVAYQEGAVVSRTIAKTEGGSVTAFAFDRGQGLSEHTTPFDALVQLLDGEVEIRIAGKPFHLKQGQLIIMPGGQPHALQAITRFKMMLTMLKG